MPTPSQPQDNNPSADDFWGEPIHSYSRAQAIVDGVLVDVTKAVREAGIKFPTAVTHAVWERYVSVPDELVGFQDETGRLWDIVFMLHFAIWRTKDDGPEILFELYVQNDLQKGPQPVTLKAVCGPGDTPEPVITIMSPEED